MLFRAAAKLQVGDSIVTVLDWPISAPDGQALKLVITGPVVRIKRPFAAVSIHCHRLMRENELRRRYEPFWAVAERGRQPAPPLPPPPQQPLVLIDDDDSMALLLSTILTPQHWRIERADAASVQIMLENANEPLSLLVTKSRFLVDRAPPQLPVILTIPEDAPADEGADLVGTPLRAVVRNPITVAALRAVLQWLGESQGLLAHRAAGELVS